MGLHCVTSMNALHHGYQVCRDDQTRKFLLLQGAAFLPMFRAAMASVSRSHFLRSRR